MSRTFQTEDWDRYRMDYHDPYRELEPEEQEIAVVDRALEALHEAGIVPHTGYDRAKMLAHREAVRRLFDVPWTAITPRMERLIWAVNAIVRPPTMIAAGVFYGFTFICNAGAAVGPGACYAAEQLVGLEINPAEAERAERNVRRLDPTGVARVLAEDAVPFAAAFGEPIDLVYLDADGTGGRGKGIYFDILEACYDRLHPGSVVLAHNSANAAERLRHYLALVRDGSRFRSSVNVVFDLEGLEVSVR